MKRIAILALVLSMIGMLIIPMGTISAGAEEERYPELVKVDASFQEAKPGDSFTVTVTVDNYDVLQPEKSSVILTRKGEDDHQERINQETTLSDKGNGRYEATFKVDEDWVAGAYTIAHIVLGHDDTFSSNYYNDNEYTDSENRIPDGVYTIKTGRTDVTTLYKVEAKAQTVRPGDKFTITIYASNPAGIDVKQSRIQLFCMNSFSGYYGYFQEIENGKYEVTFNVDDRWRAGDYTIDKIQIYDSKGQEAEFKRNYIKGYPGQQMDIIPDVVYEVINGDTDQNGPNLTKVDAQSQTVKQGDTFTITIYATDASGIDPEQSGISLGDLYARLEDQGDGKYVANFKVAEDQEPVDMRIVRINLYDKNGILRTYYNTELSDPDNLIPEAVFKVVEKEEEPKPSESPKPSDTPKPSDSPKPSENPKPSEAVKPSESPAPSESTKPSESPKPVEPESFVDVEEGSWYEDAVNYCASMGYMEGVGNNRFNPDDTVTRGTIAQILYAQSGKPAVDGKSDFTDVKEDKWYSDAVTWAAEEGVVAGYTDGTYKPDDPITRQQMVAILYKYAQLNGYDTTANGDLSKFKDADKLSKYAVTPMKWAVGHGVISGTDVGLEPNATATRAQVAVILQAFDKNIKK